LGYPYGPLYRFLLLTGTRLNEAAKARWEEFDPEIRRRLRERDGNAIEWSAVDPSKKVWTIPRERFKSDAEHKVPLCDDALAILESLPRFADCDLIFTLNGKTSIGGFSAAKARLDKLMAEAMRKADEKLAPWVNHDIRRVVRTNMSALKIPDHIAELVMGHGRKGLQRIYDQHQYLDE